MFRRRALLVRVRARTCRSIAAVRAGRPDAQACDGRRNSASNHHTMDLDTLKGKTLDDKLHTDLVAHVTALAEQRDAARKESIEGRKGKDKTIKELGDRLSAFAEKLGVEPDADLDTLPTAKGQAEAQKQYEAKLQKITRELGDVTKARDELHGKLTGEKRDRAIAQAVARHSFIDHDDARTLISARVRQEGEDFLFEGADGKLVPIDDGAAWLAKTKPHLVKSAGGGGSGFSGSGGGQGGSSGDFGGDRSARLAAINARFPGLGKAA